MLFLPFSVTPTWGFSGITPALAYDPGAVRHLVQWPPRPFHRAPPLLRAVVAKKMSQGGIALYENRRGMKHLVNCIYLYNIHCHCRSLHLIWGFTKPFYERIGRVPRHARRNTPVCCRLNKDISRASVQVRCFYARGVMVCFGLKVRSHYRETG